MLVVIHLGGGQVVDMLQCTLHTKVTHSDPNRNCVDFVCGKHIGRNWLILFGLGVMFCVLAYIGMARVVVLLWNRFKFAAGRLIEVRHLPSFFGPGGKP